MGYGFGLLILFQIVTSRLALAAAEVSSSEKLVVMPNCPNQFKQIGIRRSSTQPSASVDEHGMVEVSGVRYWYSGRSLSELRQYAYIRGELDTARLKGRLVLDLPTGNGAAVRDLLKEGIEAIGVDIAFSGATNQSKNLVRADWNHLPFKDGTFDTTIMNNGIFLYSTKYDDAALEAALRESLRVTSKSGGEILLTGVAEPARLEKIATKLGLTFETPYTSKDPYRGREVWTYQLKVPTGP